MILQLDSVTKEVKNTVLLEKFSYTFVSGKVYLLLGENGSGKTTLLKCISSLYAIKSGKIILDNQIVEGCKALSLYRNRISLLINSATSLMPNLTILQNIKFFMGINNINYQMIENKVFELIDAFQLNEHLEKTVFQLSKGMKQKTALIITFLKNKDIILLDEPYDGLDTNGINVLHKLIHANVRERIIIITSPSDIDMICTETIKMNRRSH